MKNFYRVASIVFILLFLLGTALLINDLTLLEDRLSSALAIKDLTQRQLMNPVLWQLVWHTAWVLAAALLAIFFLILNASRARIVIARQLEAEQEKAREEKAALQQDLNTSWRQELEDKISAFEEVLRQSLGQEDFYTRCLTHIAQALEASQGVFYLLKQYNQTAYLELEAGYAYYAPEGMPSAFELGEGFVGQAVKDKKVLVFNQLPDGYIAVPVVSGLGKGTPRSLLIAPILDEEGNILGAIELASFKQFSERDTFFIDEVLRHMAAYMPTPVASKQENPSS